jgi:hypothetical protein
MTEEAKKLGNMPAFPTMCCVESRGSWDTDNGLTRREYFAGLAMQGLASDNNLRISEIAPTAVKIADALLEELVK